MSNKTLNNGSLLFFGILLAGMAAHFIFAKNYRLSNKEVISQFEEQDYFVSYAQLHQALTDGNASGFLFIDLRREEAFAENQIPGAVNIPFENLLKKKNLRKIRKAGKLTPVLYADTEATAQKARMLLLSKGIKDIRVLGGSFESAQRYAIEQFDPAHAFFRDEKAKFDYMRYMQGEQAANDEPRAAPAIPTATAQPAGAQGGC